MREVASVRVSCNVYLINLITPNEPIFRTFIIVGGFHRSNPNLKRARGPTSESACKPQTVASDTASEDA